MENHSDKFPDDETDGTSGPDTLRIAGRKLREAAERQAATDDVLDIISNSPANAQPVFDTIVRRGSKLVPNAVISLALPIADGKTADAVAVADDGTISSEAWRTRFPFPLTREYMHGVAMLDGQLVDIPDVANAPNKETAGAKNFLKSGYRAVTMIPLLREGNAIGVLSVVRLAPGPLSAEQLSTLKTFAAQAVIAIENTRIVRELRQTNEVLERVSHQLAKYISPQLYQTIISGEEEVGIASRRKKLTIFFSDIVGFTEITDQLEAEELTALLNQYLTEMSEIALAHGGTVDKFIGDAIIVYFGDPDTLGPKRDADQCVRMAIAMQDRVTELHKAWLDAGLERAFELRIGINTGYCTVGNFGSELRMDYTIIGNEVNLAARLEATADVGGILLANETFSLVRDWVVAEEGKTISVKGFHRPIRTYRVSGTRDTAKAGEQVIRRDIDGLSLAIDPDRLTRAEAIKELEGILARLRE